jgi:hypothetical protein
MDQNALVDEIIFLPPLPVQRQFTLVNEAQVTGLELPYPLTQEYKEEGDQEVYRPQMWGDPELLPDQDAETEMVLQSIEHELSVLELPSPLHQEVWILQDYPGRTTKNVLRAVKRKYYRLYSSRAQRGETFIPFRTRCTEDFDGDEYQQWQYH